MSLEAKFHKRAVQWLECGCDASSTLTICQAARLSCVRCQFQDAFTCQVRFALSFCKTCFLVMQHQLFSSFSTRFCSDLTTFHKPPKAFSIQSHQLSPSRPALLVL